MEVSESVKVEDPLTGRRVTVMISEQEVNAILTVGLNTMLAAGLISLSTSADDRLATHDGSDSVQ